MNGDPFQNLPGCAHPFAQHRSMGGRLVVGMVDGVRHDLRGQDPADEEEADGKANRKESLQGSGHRSSSTYPKDYGSLC